MSETYGVILGNSKYNSVQTFADSVVLPSWCVHMCLCMCTWMGMFMCTCLCAHTCVISVHSCIYVLQVCVYVYTHTHTHTHTHTYTHTHNKARADFLLVLSFCAVYRLLQHTQQQNRWGRAASATCLWRYHLLNPDWWTVAVAPVSLRCFLLLECLHLYQWQDKCPWVSKMPKHLPVRQFHQELKQRAQPDTLSETVVSLRIVVRFVTWLISRTEFSSTELVLV